MIQGLIMRIEHNTRSIYNTFLLTRTVSVWLFCDVQSQSRKLLPLAVVGQTETLRQKMRLLSAYDSRAQGITLHSVVPLTALFKETLHINILNQRKLINQLN